MKTLIQNYKAKFQKTLDSLDLKRNPEMQLLETSMRSKIDLADYLLEENVKTLRELEGISTELEGMKYQIRCSSGCFDQKTKAEIIFRLDSKTEFLKELIESIKEKDAPIFSEVYSFLSETLEIANDFRDKIGNGLQTMNQGEMRKLDILTAFCSKLEETMQEWNVGESEEISEGMRIWK